MMQRVTAIRTGLHTKSIQQNKLDNTNAPKQWHEDKTAQKDRNRKNAFLSALKIYRTAWKNNVSQLWQAPVGLLRTFCLVQNQSILTGRVLTAHISDFRRIHSFKQSLKY